MSNPTAHVPVLLDEVLRSADLDNRSLGGPAWIVVDGTLGGGGHATEFLNRLREDDHLIGIDRDPGVIERAQALIGTDLQKACHKHFVCGSYRDLPNILLELGLPAVDVILLDLGLSSDQLADTSRGFSFRAGGALDLRFNPEQGISARELLRKIDEKELADIIYQFGEERFSRRIARNIVERRRTDPIETAEQLADLIHRSVPGRVHGRVDSATRTFQALRIAVNQELEHVTSAVEVLPPCLTLGGRLMIISFHSLEDRIVKHAMRGSNWLQVLTKKPIIPSDEEMDRNSRSRSAKMRVALRVDPS